MYFTIYNLLIKDYINIKSILSELFYKFTIKNYYL
jgi:hypothetical protein